MQQQSAHRLLESRATAHCRCRQLRGCLRAWLRNASAQRREREAERKRAWLRVALRRREERDRWALDRMLMVSAMFLWRPAWSWILTNANKRFFTPSRKEINLTIGTTSEKQNVFRFMSFRWDFVSVVGIKM